MATVVSQHVRHIGRHLGFFENIILHFFFKTFIANFEISGKGDFILVWVKDHKIKFSTVNESLFARSHSLISFSSGFSLSSRE